MLPPLPLSELILSWRRPDRLTGDESFLGLQRQKGERPRREGLSSDLVWLGRYPERRAWGQAVPGDPPGFGAAELGHNGHDHDRKGRDTVRLLRKLVPATAALVLVSTGSVALADHGGHVKAAAKVFTLTPSTHGNPEGVAAQGHSGSFFVGATGDGTIYRGTVDSPTVTEFIAGGVGKFAVGMKVAGGRLYVAGGPTGKIVVYDLATRQQVASFDTGAGGFLNDLVVTHRGDVFVTDSFRPIIWHVTAAQVTAGSGTPEQIGVGPEIAFTTGFNLNGIVARGDGRRLIVVQTNTGKLFRIDLGTGPSSARRIQQIDASALPGGDGMLLDRGRLVVVEGAPPALQFLKLDRGDTRARLVGTRTDPTLHGPSTVARAHKLLLVVNADFATSTVPFTVSGLPRGGHG
jgi:sugar lactone lactonase YvrE